MGKNSKIKRYITAFTIIIAVLLVLIIWNISYGSIDMKFRDITNALFLRDESTLSKIIWQIRMPIVRRGIVSVGISASEFFPESNSRTICAWNFFRGKTCCGTGDDFFAGKRDYDKFAWNGDRSVYRFAAGNGICSRHII